MEEERVREREREREGESEGERERERVREGKGALPGGWMGSVLWRPRPVTRHECLLRRSGSCLKDDA